MSKYIWLLDAGHGGMKDGKYTTAPAKMHVFEDGLTFYEGVNNRAIVSKLVGLLDNAGIEYTLVFDPQLDTPLKDRVSIANRLYKEQKLPVYLSIHSDAMPDGAHGKGSGFSVFTSKGQTRSDRVAEVFCKTYQSELPQFKFRKDLADGDTDKEENFYVLRKTHGPALLVENLFFDNRKEAEFLLSEVGQGKIALTLFKSIQATENKKPI